MELIQLEPQQLRKSEEYIPVSGEVIKHQTAFKKADFRTSIRQCLCDSGSDGTESQELETVLMKLHSLLKVEEAERAIVDLIGLSHIVYSYSTGLMDMECLSSILKMSEKRVSLHRHGDLRVNLNKPRVGDGNKLHNVWS